MEETGQEGKNKNKVQNKKRSTYGGRKQKKTQTIFWATSQVAGRGTGSGTESQVAGRGTGSGTKSQVAGRGTGS